jgi:cell wall-associated NlpC family hydrolase
MTVQYRLLAGICALFVAVSLPIGGAQAAPTEPISPLVVPDEMYDHIDALPGLRQAIGDAAETLTQARTTVVVQDAVVDAVDVAAQAQRAQLDSFARNAYVHGSPTFGQLLIQTDAVSLGEALHGIALQRFAGVDQAIQTVMALQRFRDRQFFAASARQEAQLADARYREALNALAATTARLHELAAGAGDPGLPIAALSVAEDGCATVAPQRANPAGVDVHGLCTAAVADANRPTAAAVRWAFARLGAHYACKGVGRQNRLFQFDCSSFVSRAYQDAGGIDLQASWLPTTKTMLTQTSRYRAVRPADIRPGDLVLYETCPPPEEDAEPTIADGDTSADVLATEDEAEAEEAVCDQRHVVMYLGDFAKQRWMIHANVCGGVVNLAPFWGFEDEPGRVYLKTVRLT